ncbi:hypothetical protein Pcinc_027598 [Petrolisthes cinctipes]|uniref:C-type lectin domain-containing protein n=1 Tax=Petrolisthes cinctipes TaxID=88211 RepID=A0AAE1KA24_PETCI|nr:hypothetical protein Pcinc_027598 [Petrolisthes cinctipes]
MGVVRSSLPSLPRLLLLLLLCSTPGLATCPEADQIHCGGSSRCTRIRYICDGDNDCGDNSDEASSLCAVWRNGECERNSARCTRNGRADCITISHYCTVDNPPCEGSLDMRLCQMLSDGKISPLHNIVLTTTTPSPTTPATTIPSIHMTGEINTEEFETRLTSTISHPECPQLYTKVGQHCISVFFIGNMTWPESLAFCKAIGGDLMSLSSDLTIFSTIVQHLSSHQVTADFWVGGRYINDSMGWTWLDEKPMTMGSPYWAVRHQDNCSTRSLYVSEMNQTMVANQGVCYNYTQAPTTPLTGHCVAITYEHYYYLSDQNCFAKKSPMCIKPGGVDPEQAL